MVRVIVLLNSRPGDAAGFHSDITDALLSSNPDQGLWDPTMHTKGYKILHDEVFTESLHGQANVDASFPHNMPTVQAFIHIPMNIVTTFTHGLASHTLEANVRSNSITVWMSSIGKNAYEWNSIAKGEFRLMFEDLGK